jgi:tetratricopeptide (TPR) repeat protein
MEAFEDAKAAATRAGDEELRLRAQLTRLDVSTITDPTADMKRILALADELETVAKREGRKLGRIVAEHARANAFLNACHWMDDLAALERARVLLQPDEDPRLWNYTQVFSWNSLRYGPVPVPEAIARIKQDAATGNNGIDGRGLIAGLLAMQGDFDQARAMESEMRAYLLDRGMTMRVGSFSLHGGAIESLVGDYEAAHRELASGIETLRGMGETGVLSTLASMDDEALYRLGRRPEMEEAIQLARESGAPHDISTQSQWRWVAAMAAADDGNLDEAERLISEAVAMVEPTDFLEYRAQAFEALAHVEARAGRPEGWRLALDRAMAEHEAKANLVGAQRIRDLTEKGPPEPVIPTTSR